MSDHNVINFPGKGAPKPPDASAPKPPPPPVVKDTPDDPVELAPGTLTVPRPEFLQAAVEAVLFSADKPVTFDTLRACLGDPKPQVLRAAIETVRDGYLRRGAGLRLVEVAKGYQLRTVPQAAVYVGALHGKRPFRLSKAAIETLAMVAYRQPVTRHDVEEIRGVDSGGILRGLIEKRLLTVMGRKEEPGRPLLYGTSPEFLELFGLKDLGDLPTLRDLRELQADDGREGPAQLDLPDL
jgi:segregation and condensation protein B